MPTRKCETWKSGGVTAVAFTSPPLSASICPAHKTLPKLTSAYDLLTIMWEPSKPTAPSWKIGGFAVISFTRPPLSVQICPASKTLSKMTTAGDLLTRMWEPSNLTTTCCLYRPGAATCGPASGHEAIAPRR